MARLTNPQIQKLLSPIHPNRVKRTQGFDHLEAYDVRAMLIRIFGFAGWSLKYTIPTACIYERDCVIGKEKKPGFAVAYRAHLEIVIHTPEGDAVYAGSAVGESKMGVTNLGDCHDMALKTAESQALKRAATNLGDQFGLSLYNNGSTEAYVQRIYGYDASSAKPPQDDPAPVGDEQVAAPPPPPDVEQAPAPAEAVPQPAAGAGDPVQLEMLPGALDGLTREEKQRLADWGRERGIKNLRQPGDKVGAVLKRCEELVAARG